MPLALRWLFCSLLLAAGLAGCGAPTAPAAADTPAPASAPTTMLAPPTDAPTAVPTATRPFTPMPLSTVTQTPTSTPSPTTAPTATPTLHPMMIAAQRAQEYPGSDLTLVEELTPGVSYRRYRAAYLSEGLRLYALLTVPNGERPAGGWPAIVFLHGYIPPAEYRLGQRYVAYVDRFARDGYVVLMPDLRGHDRSEGEASGAFGHPGYIVDVLNAVSSLARYPEVDATRLGMWGHSMGGYLTLRAMVLSREIKAGVIWAGVVAPYADLYTGWRRDRPAVGQALTPVPSPSPYPYARDWRGWAAEFGAPEENPAFWEAISANAFLSDLSGPLQLHHGTADDSVPFAFSEALQAQVLAAGGEVEFYVYEGENHNLSGSLTLALNRSAQFFDRHLK